ncbi:MAG TPA: hypothetical protein PK199_08290 [Bacteroidales bacterium]|nr:hypothetical protein [Bacteroidales bacterium]
MEIPFSKIGINFTIILLLLSTILSAQNKEKLKYDNDTIWVSDYEYVVRRKNNYPIIVNTKTQNITVIDSNKDTLESGIFISLYPNGNINEVGKKVENVMHEFYFQFYSNNKIKYVTIYNYGFKDGAEIFIEKNGCIRRENSYENGKFHGVNKRYSYRDNRLLAEDNFRNGIKEGLQKYYYWNGNILMITNYENGYAEGKGEQYTRYGKLKYINYYTKGELIKREKIKFIKRIFAPRIVKSKFRSTIIYNVR